MINLNVVSRIAEDKNSFPNLIEVLHTLKNEGINDVQILFIGAIYSRQVYQNTLNLAHELGVSSNISFTETSIPLHDLTDEVKNGYFINFTIAQFTGFSGLEGIRHGLKTILYNVDSTWENELSNSIAYCRTTAELTALIKAIRANQTKLDEEIKSSNQELINKFTLDPSSSKKLLDIMLPDKSVN
ncbi:hypothetical protein SAMN05192574_106213 [Mucilaginibacter gossypiicola]|uniref:Glycosyl transferases group 1 n=1 Tax=Mucilaginibacter gossypiicola TaxID=551995 RepID=A0A1H8N2R1_9SPHI|nr:hypothetical protein [Mucilaginibacter gossypiicola]SEO23852.1 hypothetical protein SAMN05192574_106213 [Mucilaginibacter gossypiicola]